MRTRALLLSLCLMGLPGVALAQDAGAGAADASAAPVLPPGHPSINGAPQQAPDLRQVQMPESFADERVGSPAGTILVRVVDAQANPLPGVEVRVGTMREGERGPSRTVRTGPDGVVLVEGLETGANVAYRVSTELDGAKYSTQPFQLPAHTGYRAQLVRFDVDHVGRAVLLWDARIELHFKDDRLIVVERMSLVNLTGMSLGGMPSRPVAYVPSEPLRFELPAGYTAFNVAPSMTDLRITEENGAAVLRGSLPPTGTEPVEIAFQYHIKLEGGDVDLRATFPLPVVTGTVISEAPRGLSMAVDGMPTPEARDSRGEHVLVTGVERRPNDPPLREVRVHLVGIPAAAGPSRTVAAIAAGLLVLGALGWAFSQRAKRAVKRDRATITEERERVLAEARELAAQFHRDEIGPVNFEKRRRELSLWLASLLKEQEG